MSKQAIFLMGPTASGKTNLAMQIAQQFPVDVISVDSAMIYQNMDIGTGKPSREELARVPHALVDICQPTESYSVQQFCLDAVQAMNQSHQAGRIPLLVGGTMLYFRSLLHGISKLPSADDSVRNELYTQALEIGWDAMHQQLCKVDPVLGERIHPNDPQRIQRALEVYQLSGTPMSELQKQKVTFLDNWQVKSLALIPHRRAWLDDQIAQRFEQMLQQGLVEEVAALYKNPQLNLDCPSIRCVGYRQVWQYLDGKLNRDEMIARSITATRQLAKRQHTWLRSWEDKTELVPEQVQQNAPQITKILTNFLASQPFVKTG